MKKSKPDSPPVFRTPVRYLGFFHRYRWVILVSLLVLTGLLTSGIRYLTFTTDYRVYFSPDDPYLKSLNSFQRTYTKDDTVLFVLSPKQGSVFVSPILKQVAWLTEQAWSIPYAQRVESLQNFQYTEGRKDELIVRDLYQKAVELSPDQIAEIRRIALGEPLLVNRLISPNGKVTGVLVTVHLPGVDEKAEIPRVVAAVRRLVHELTKRDPNLEVRLTGGVMMSHAFPEASERDIATLFPLMFGLVVVVLWLSLRSLTATFGVCLVLLFSIAATMGLAGWLGFAISPPAAAAVNIILTVAVADCIHLLTTFLRGLQRGWLMPLDRTRIHAWAMAESLQINFKPIFLTSFTTVVGFLSLNFSDSPPYRDLGNIAAMGVGFAFLYTLALLPLLAVLVPFTPRRSGKTAGFAWTGWLADWVIRRDRVLLVVMPVAVLGLSVFALRNELDDDLIRYFSPAVKFRADTEYATNHLTGMYLLEYSLPAPPGSGVTDPQYLRALERFAQWYRRQPETLHVYSIADILKRLNQNLHANDPAWYRVPDDRKLAAQYLLIYEMSLPEGLELSDRINVSRTASRFTVTLKSLSSKQLLDLERRADRWLRENAPAYFRSRAVGMVMFAHVGQNNLRSMLMGIAVAFMLISLILVAAFRSPFWGLISMIPNIAPLLMAFGLWGLIDGRVSVGLSVVLGIALGIVVDDTIHFLSKYRHARIQLNFTLQEAVRFAFMEVGGAMWITSVVLMTGFLVLTLSDFEVNAQMGLMVAVTIGFALLVDFLLLPPLLLLWDRGHSEAI